MYNRRVYVFISIILGSSYVRSLEELLFISHISYSIVEIAHDDLHRDLLWNDINLPKILFVKLEILQHLIQQVNRENKNKNMFIFIDTT